MHEENSREEDNVGSFIIALLCFGMVAFLVYFIYSSVVQPIKDDIGAHQARKQNIAHYDEDTNTLVVYQRQPGMADQIEISPEYGLPNIKHVNDSQVYTGTVIGGVAVGNVTTFKGGDYLTPGAKTGYYKVNYKYAKHLDTGGYLGGSIYYIELSIGNYMAAKQNPVIRKFVEPRETTKGQLVCSSDKLTPAGRAFKAIPDDFSSEGRLRLLGHSLTRRECEYLRDWLASANADQNLSHEKELRENQSINGYYDTTAFDVVGTELRKYKYEINNATIVTIPDGITSIGRSAFSHATGIQEVFVPDSVKTIDEYAFHYCKSLSAVHIPQHVDIHYSAFNQCTNLADKEGFVIVNKALFSYLGTKPKASIPDGVELIRRNAFYSSKITSVVLPDSVKVVESYAFQRCADLQSIQLSSGIKTIDGHVFDTCTSLKRLILPEGVEQINAAAFVNCSKLFMVQLPKSLKKVSSYAFQHCDALTQIIAISGDTKIAKNAYSSCPNAKVIIQKPAEEDNNLPPQTGAQVDPFHRKTFIVSGLAKSDEYRIRKEILRCGGILSTTVSKSLDYLVCTEVRYGITNRIDTALDNKVEGYQVKIITIQEFENLVAVHDAFVEASETDPAE